MKWIFNDGGRAKAGLRGICGDCVTRAIAIAAQLPYLEVGQALANINAAYNGRRRNNAASHARTFRRGIPTRSKAFKGYMHRLGWTWTPTMGIGTGCRVHLADGELPNGRLIVVVSRHYCAVIDGVIHDISNPGRNSSRCVYGYWSKK